MTITIEQVQKAQKRCRVRLMGEDHVATWNEMLPLFHYRSQVTYNPLGLSKKPGTYKGQADTTFLQRNLSGEEKVGRQEIISTWIWRVSFDCDTPWQPTGALLDRWEWKRTNGKWFGYAK